MLKVLHHLRAGGWPRTLHTLRLFFQLFVAQAGVQLLTMITGFLIIRLLDKDEYASYTIINTLIPVMLMLSDNGIGTGLSAIGRTVWEDDAKMGALVNTGLRLRRNFALVTFALVGPLLAWMLYRNHAPATTILLLTGVALAGIVFQITCAVMKKVLELRQNIGRLGKLDLATAILRLALVLAFAAIFHINAFLTTLAGTCALCFEAIFFVRAVRAQIVWTAPPDPQYRATIHNLVRRTLPLTVYFCLQGQIGIWLIGLFGNQQQIADIGAATRLGLLFNTLAMAFNTIAMTRFAREMDRRRMITKFSQIAGFLVTSLAGFVALAWLFPQPFILLLGEKYADISNLLWLVILSSGLVTLAGAAYGLNLSKGWIPPASITIPIELLTQLALLFCLKVNTVPGVLTFICLACVPPTVLNLAYLFRRIRKEGRDGGSPQGA